MDASELALLMLEWEKVQRKAQELEDKIKPVVLEMGKTQTVGNVRATYSQGRKSYDYEEAAATARVPEDVIAVYTTPSVDWRGLCKALDIEDVPFTQGSPSVSLKLLD